MTDYAAIETMLTENSRIDEVKIAVHEQSWIHDMWCPGYVVVRTTFAKQPEWPDRLVTFTQLDTELLEDDVDWLAEFLIRYGDEQAAFRMENPDYQDDLLMRLSVQ